MSKNWEHPEVQKLLHHRLTYKEPSFAILAQQISEVLGNKVGISTVKDKIFKMKLTQSQHNSSFSWQPFQEDKFLTLNPENIFEKENPENSEIIKQEIFSPPTPAEISEDDFFNSETNFKIPETNSRNSIMDSDFGFEISDLKYLFMNRPKLSSNFGNIEYGKDCIILKQARCSVQIHVKNDYSGIKHVIYNSGGHSKTFKQ